MKSNIKITFEDWLQDTETHYSCYIKQIDDTIGLGKTGNYPDYLKKHNLIEEEEFKKIEKAQREAYDIVVNYHLEKTIQKLHDTISKAPDKEMFLQARKKNLISNIESFPSKIIEDVYAGRWSKMRIDSVTYHKIIERHEKGIAPEPLKGVNNQNITVFGPRPDEFDIKRANITIEIDKHFSLTLMFKELLEIEKILNQDGEYDSQMSDKPSVNNQDEVNSLTTTGIYQKYHSLYDDGKGMKQKAAYKIVEDWLLNDLKLTKEEVKEKWNVTLDIDTFTRSARNNRS